MDRPAESKILLKARPTWPQLLDRLAAPRPAGLELYLDQSDLRNPALVSVIHQFTRDADLPGDFVWIVEAPIRTLGDSFFDLSRNDQDHRETVQRVTEVGAEIGAVAANVHVVAPTLDSGDLSASARGQRLDQAMELLGYYVECCRIAKLVPQVENVPPVGRMREGAFVYSSIGATPSDLAELGQAFPGLRITWDTSHAGLYLNWCHTSPDQLELTARRVASFYQSVAFPSSLADYARLLNARITTVHVSNASGLMGEGLRYAEGDFDLDLALADLCSTVPFLVTETLEREPERATDMRDAQERLTALRRRGGVLDGARR